MKNITKKKLILYFAGAPLFVLVSYSLFASNEWCYKNLSCRDIMYSDSLEILFFVLLALLVSITPSLITLPLKPAVFDAWKRYAIWSIPVILILVAWIETVGEGGGLPGQFHPGYLFYPLFFFIHFTISLIIIIRVWLKTRRV